MINYFLVINAFFLFFIIFLHSASAREAEGRDAGCGDRGVRLGLHPAHRHLGLHAEQQPCRPLRQTQRGRSDHGRQRHQSGGPAARHLSGHHQGLDISKHVFNTYQLLSAFITYFCAYACVSGPEESRSGETKCSELPTCYHCPHKETRPAIPAGFQRSEWHSKCQESNTTEKMTNI